MSAVSRVEVSWVSPRGRPVTETEPSVPRATTMRQLSDDPTAATVKGSETVAVRGRQVVGDVGAVTSGAGWSAPTPSEMTVSSPIEAFQVAM